MKESELVDIIKQNTDLQSKLADILDVKSIFFKNEDRFINGMIIDFTATSSNNKIIGLFECKGDDIGVTDFVRGIGQVLQYQHFVEDEIDPKSRGYESNAKSVLIFPSDLLVNNKFNLGKFRFPKETLLIEVNNFNHLPRLITENELKKLSRDNSEFLQTISQYYIRDNRVFEYFILLHSLSAQYFLNKTKIDRKEYEEVFLKSIEVINNGNWRNAFISLASFGFIDSNNLPSKTGIDLIFNGYYEFAFLMYESYIKPYFKEIIELFDGKETIDFSNAQICELITNKYNNKDVLFLTESNGRYISSWLNIMRDDYGIIDFQPRNNFKKINYNILELNKEKIIENIKTYSKASVYLDNYLNKI